jgi:uncharacterized protein YaiE (UPF0345 family)
MKHNIYFDGKVQSLGLITEEGNATVGVISRGKFTFSTSSEERMIVTSGTLKLKLPGQNWKPMGRNAEWVVPANSSFDVEADSDVSYICYYK